MRSELEQENAELEYIVDRQYTKIAVLVQRIKELEEALALTERLLREAKKKIRLK